MALSVDGNAKYLRAVNRYKKGLSTIWRMRDIIRFMIHNNTLLIASSFYASTYRVISTSPKNLTVVFGLALQNEFTYIQKRHFTCSSEIGLEGGEMCSGKYHLDNSSYIWPKAKLSHINPLSSKHYFCRNNLSQCDCTVSISTNILALHWGKETADANYWW